MTCRCHADPVYAGLIDCPKCGHRSFDPICQACERRRCGYEEDPPTALNVRSVNRRLGSGAGRSEEDK